MTPEIRAFEYAIGVFAVLIGLAIADIATSFHRLLHSKSAAKWDPLALSAALYAMCMAIYMWFDLWGVRNFAATRHFLFLYFVVCPAIRALSCGCLELARRNEFLDRPSRVLRGESQKILAIGRVVSSWLCRGRLLFRRRNDCENADIDNHRVDCSDDRAACSGARVIGDEIAGGALHRNRAAICRDVLSLWTNVYKLRLPKATYGNSLGRAHSSRSTRCGRSQAATGRSRF